MSSLEESKKVFSSENPELHKEMCFTNSAEAISYRAVKFADEGKRLLEKWRYGDALACLDKAMYLDAQVKGLQYLRAVSLIALGRFREAEIALDAEIKMQPYFKDAFLLKISLQKRNG